MSNITVSRETVPEPLKSFEIVPLSEDIRQIIGEEMEGLGTIPFDKVRIPSGGGLTFELPGEDEDHPESVPELVGVILDHHPINAWWRDEYSGGNQQPDCSSLDGKTGILTGTGDTRDCSVCPFNEFGSGRSGKGKACKNMHRLYILRSGEPLPLILNLPPTSLQALRNYLAKKVAIRGKRSWQVVTRITLKKETNADGIRYSQAVFAKVCDLGPEECRTIEPMVLMIRELTRAASNAAARGSVAAVADVEFQEVEEADCDEPF